MRRRIGLITGCAAVAALLILAGCSRRSKKVPAPTSSFHFEHFFGAIPDDAVIGGISKKGPMFVCQGAFKGALPGKLASDRCNVSWGGQEVVLEHFEVLRSGGAPYYWRLTTGNAEADLADAFVGGDEQGHPMHVCMASHGGEVHVGRIGDGEGTYCSFGYGRKECLTRTYYVLVDRPNPADGGGKSAVACGLGTPVQCPLAAGCCPAGVEPSCVDGLPNDRCSFPVDCL